MRGLQLERGELALGLVDLQLRRASVQGDELPARPRERLALALRADGVALLLRRERDVDVRLDDLVPGEELRVAALERLGGRRFVAVQSGVATEVPDGGSWPSQRCRDGSLQ